MTLRAAARSSRSSCREASRPRGAESAAGDHDRATPAAVLVLDDETDVAETIADALRRAGYRVVTVTSAQAALQACAKARFDAVLSDVRIAYVDGLRFLDEVRLRDPRLFGPDGTEIPLTAMEFSLLKTFVRNRGRVLTRDQLLDQAHDRGWEPYDRSIDLRISWLRRKIEVDAGRPELIRTIRGIGYMFDAETRLL